MTDSLPVILKIKIAITTNTKFGKFLDVKFKFTNSPSFPYERPNVESIYASSIFNYHPNILKDLYKSINLGIEALS